MDRFMTTDGKEFPFITVCPFCALDSGLNHAYACPNNPNTPASGWYRAYREIRVEDTRLANLGMMDYVRLLKAEDADDA